MRIQLSTDLLPERDRVAFWHDAVCRDMFGITPRWGGADAGFQAIVDLQLAGRFALTALTTSHGAVEKSASDVARAGSDHVLVYYAAASNQHYQVGRQACPMQPGDVCIVPMDRRFECSAASITFRSLLIPAAVLNPLTAGRELERVHHLPAVSPLGGLLATGLNAAAAQLPLLSDELGDAVLANLSGLVALALGISDEGHEAGRSALLAARLDAVRRHIDQHRAEPMLDPARVAAALGMSVRQLHAVFRHSDETFTRYLLRRRLEACRATLSSPLGVGRSVADVAFGWGFNSLSVFYRAFAGAFGMSPGDVRATARKSASYRHQGWAEER